MKQKREVKRAIPGGNVIASGDGKREEILDMWQLGLAGARICEVGESLEMCAV